MTIKFTTTAQKGGKVKCLVYGPSGIGKTTLARTCPKPLIISSEKKLLALKDENIPVILIENHEDLESAIDFINTDKKAKAFETVVVDSISDIAETVLSFFKSNPVDGNTHPQAAYGHMADKLGPLIKQIRDINNKHVYVIAKAKMMEDQLTNVNMWSPSMPGRVLGPNIPYEFDFVFAMRAGETDKGSKFRYLQTQADLQWLAKGNGNLNAIERPNLGNIFKKALKQVPKTESTTEPKKESESEKEVEPE